MTSPSELHIDILLDAFDEIGKAASAAGQRLELLVYGGSALMLAGNFRYSTEDVDIAPIGNPWPKWFAEVSDRLAHKNGWSADWINDAVGFHLSRAADRNNDHVVFGSFPRTGDEPGLTIQVPTAEYMLAMKLKAMRVLEPKKGEIEAKDIKNLLKVLKITTADEAISVMAKFFPISAASAEKQRFLLKNVIFKKGPATIKEEAANAPRYPVRGRRTNNDGPEI